MKNLRFSFSSVLLAALLVPVIMTFQIFPAETQFWQFSLIFLGLLLNFAVDILPIREKLYYLYKYVLLWALIILSIGGAFMSAIITRHFVAPTYNIHDIILQLEAAIHFFIRGINPYATTYFGTPMELFNYAENAVNPALYHFVMQPFYLLFSIPFYGISIKTLHYFDGRMPLYFLFFSLLIMAFVFVKDREKKLTFVTLLAFNPAMFLYTLEGRSDFFMYAFFFAGLILLSKRKYALSGILLALAFTVKQSVWPFFPLYFFYILYESKNNLWVVVKRLITFFLTVMVIVLPFFLWNPDAFFKSTVLYLSGNTEHSYPISGYGFGMLMHQIGFIKDLNSSYPFVIWQAIIVLPLLGWLVFILRKYHTMKMLIFAYGILIFVYWYFSRYFNNSHVGFLSMVFMTAYFWPDEKL